MTDEELLILWHQHPELHSLILTLLESQEQPLGVEDLPDDKA